VGTDDEKELKSSAAGLKGWLMELCATWTCQLKFLLLDFPVHTLHAACRKQQPQHHSLLASRSFASGWLQSAPNQPGGQRQ
jgi:hypothetical protein